jgi:hypothetical protein
MSAQDGRRITITLAPLTMNVGQNLNVVLTW